MQTTFEKRNFEGKRKGKQLLNNAIVVEKTATERMKRALIRLAKECRE
jgi:hypothetical protein